MNVTVLDHPLVSHYLTILRRESTPPARFREAATSLAGLLAVEATSHLAVNEIEIMTPLSATIGHELATNVSVIPVLRAGLGLLQPVLDVLPAAGVGFVGVARNHETALPEEYYVNLPETIGSALVLEPMLATGGSLAFAVDAVKAAGADNVATVSVVAAPEGLEVMKERHPDVRVVVAAVDEGLNETFYIMPGLGDMGDRLFGT
jgi:uracil phosphoribosyltransferase